jgi:hypothetical protein
MTDANREHRWVYGVAHIDAGVLGHYQPHPTRASAEKDLSACLEDESAQCYLVRARVHEWEQVPNGS